MMSTSSSDLSALMNSGGISLTKPAQLRQRALEPGPGPRDGVGLLHVLPDLLLADQLHEAADQRVGGARARIAGDRILAAAPPSAGRSRGVPSASPPSGRRIASLIELDDAVDQALDEADDPVDRAR